MHKKKKSFMDLVYLVSKKKSVLISIGLGVGLAQGCVKLIMDHADSQAISYIHEAKEAQELADLRLEVQAIQESCDSNKK